VSGAFTVNPGRTLDLAKMPSSSRAAASRLGVQFGAFFVVR
jgi:hypothetical protein